ncbi:hypothetical protein ACS0PU_002604 [Formica fusca]
MIIIYFELFLRFFIFYGSIGKYTRLHIYNQKYLVQRHQREPTI